MKTVSSLVSEASKLKEASDSGNESFFTKEY
jgi:hypothetical protein